MSEALRYLDPASGLSLQSQIRQKLVDGILSGAFPPGTRLPSSRKLAEYLGVVRNTVVLAYEQLIDEGDVPWVWVVSNCLIGITWAYTVVYLLGLMSRYDTTGQMAALGGFASKVGLASGPVAAAALSGQNDYPRVIWAAVLALAISLLAIIYPARLQLRPTVASAPAPHPAETA